ncbi:MAG: hypothetical protein JXR52_02620 [Bacteroidales bacterium]|nr:hypothetical protein [Bacteroidales bacterium]
MKKLWIAVGLFLTFPLIAQDITIPEYYEAKENVINLGVSDAFGNIQTFDNRYEGVKGTPFIFEEWHPGEVYLSDKKKVFFNDINYNAFENEIVYMEVGSNRARVMNKYIVDLFRLFGKDTLTFVPLQLPGGKDKIFANVLYNRNSVVYKVFKKEFIKANYEGGYSADRRYDEFVDKVDLFFRKYDDDILYKVRRSKKYMISAFPEQSREITKFIKSNNLKFKDEQDIVALMGYFDGLK